MIRLTFLLAVLIPLTTSIAVAEAPGKPTIDLQVSGSGGTGGQGVATVTGKVKLPPGWTLSIHTLTVRFQDSGGGTTLNAFGSVKGADIDFSLKVNLKTGSYKVWGVIDVKDADGNEKQITSSVQSVTIS
jgi:hypothetical protein